MAAKAPTYERPREREKGLGRFWERALRAVVEAIFARGGQGDESDEIVPPPADRIDWVCREVDDFLARVTVRSRVLVLLSLFAVSVLGPLFARRFGTLGSIALTDRVHALERFERSMFAPALLAVKALASVHYYEHPDAAREVGFDAACMTTTETR
jgi:hypothetical protein